MKPQMILVVIPNNKTDAYHAIKKVLCCDMPIPSQCVTATVIKKFISKDLTPLALKVPSKMPEVEEK